MTCSSVIDVAGQSVACTLPVGHHELHRNDLRRLEWPHHQKEHRMESALDLTALSAADRHACAIGVGLVCKHLDALVKEATTLGRISDAQAYSQEADGLRAEVVEPDRAEPGSAHLLERHQRTVALGLDLLIKNRKALMGTLRGAGYPQMAEQVERDITDLESRVAPRFREQQELALVGASDGDLGNEE
jgi:hypothetical protein